MLTKIKIRNFKRFDEVDIELGQTVVFVGPNNSGKSTALQGLILWETGLRKWNERRGGKKVTPEKKPGVVVNRRELVAIPIPEARLIWRDLRVRETKKVGTKWQPSNIRIEIIVYGLTEGKEWKCGLEFDYANEESFYCRPLRKGKGKTPERMIIPSEAGNIRVALLPPMSGLVANETRLDQGAINVRIGEGRTAEVLRNLCYRIHEQDPKTWEKLTKHIESLFGVELSEPIYLTGRGEITMNYKEPSGVKLDISCSGRGLQQTLLLIAHLYANPNTILLLDEPDAHLEILRQRQIYQIITNVSQEQGCQVIAASHSEILLNEAADRDVVVAFVGKPHRINEPAGHNRSSQVLKALKDIGYDQYYQAEQTGWVLYLEGATDLAILRAFAKTLNHDAQQYLERPFVRYVSTNLPQKAKDHFYGLREAKKNLVGIAIFDRLDKELQTNKPLVELMWKQREIENYLCLPEVLMAYATYDQPDDLFGHAEAKRREEAMKKAIKEVEEAISTLDKGKPWSSDIKASDDFLDPLFKRYFKKLGLSNLLTKTDYHVLASLVPGDKIDNDVIDKLDAIVKVARKAKEG